MQPLQYLIGYVAQEEQTGPEETLTVDVYAAVSPNGTYKVALALDPGNDYHWYRQNPDGSWSHKPGYADVTNQDGSGIIIEDPETANRGRYVEFVAFFYVSPWNHLYNGDSTNTALINLLENTHIQHNAHASGVTDTVADLS